MDSGFLRRWVRLLHRNDAVPAQLPCERHAGVPFQSAKSGNRLFHVLQGFNHRLRRGPRKSRSQVARVHCHPVQEPCHRESRNPDKNSRPCSRATYQGNQDARAPADVSPGSLQALTWPHKLRRRLWFRQCSIIQNLCCVCWTRSASRTHLNRLVPNSSSVNGSATLRTSLAFTTAEFASSVRAENQYRVFKYYS